jgi:hypothetical protein
MTAAIAADAMPVALTASAAYVGLNDPKRVRARRAVVRGGFPALLAPLR